MMTPDQLVKNEIYYNVSMLINELYSTHSDDLWEVMSKEDYESAVTENATDSEISEAMEWIGYDSLDDLDADDWREICEYLHLEPQQSEALEHWIVSEWLADELESHGEMIIRDFMGLTLWGRTTSGQHISMDGVIQRICKT